MHFCIQFAARRAATVPAVIWKDKTLGLSLVFQYFSTIVALSVRYLKQQNSRPISMTFGYQNRDFGVALGDILGPLGTLLSSGGRLWAPLGAFWDMGPILTHFREKCSPILEAILAHKISKVSTNLKKWVSRKQCRKSVLPELARNGKKWILYCNYHMFWEVEHHPFR